MTILLDAKENYQIDFALDLLKQDEPVALPTETVYGLAANALSNRALAKIFKLKNRPTFDPLIVHVLDPLWVENLAIEVTALHKRLMDAFWPGPLSLIFKKRDALPDLCTASLPWVAIRSPRHNVFREILKRLDKPLAAPSANKFGSISPTRANHVIEELGPMGLEAVLDAGPCEVGLESTVLKILDDTSLEIIRPGAVSKERLEAFFDGKIKIIHRSSGHGAVVESPGQLKAHYAPRTPLSIWDGHSLEGVQAEQDILLAVFERDARRCLDLPWKKVFVLSKSDSDIEAACQLFHVLRNTDRVGARKIWVLLPEENVGLLMAIADRLKRASAAF